MKRVIILLLDSFGVGASQDAPSFGDAFADTFGHIAIACAEGRGDKEGLRQGPLNIPNLTKRGLAMLHLASTGKKLPGFAAQTDCQALYGYAVEQSNGKDTPSGHWEIAGVPVYYDWGYFPGNYPSFPPSLVEDLIKQAKIPGILGNKAASGTDILTELGQQHIQTGQPIVYTSADSVLQIAAHEEHFGLEKLYEVCEIARSLVDEYNIGRVIARPFTGTFPKFERTGNRRDYAMPPPSHTLLDKLKAQDHQVISIGKVSDIFAHQGFTECIKAHGNNALMDATLKTMAQPFDKPTLIFTNFVDFDSVYGHRRDVPGYANALEAFDARLTELDALLQEDDLVVITADHGCDPTIPGSDHTREHIPVIFYGPKVTPEFIGRRETFADIGQSIAQYFAIDPLEYGIAFL